MTREEIKQAIADYKAEHGEVSIYLGDGKWATPEEVDREIEREIRLQHCAAQIDLEMGL